MKHEIHEIPRALRLMQAQGQPQYDALVRQSGWTEKPVFIVGSGSSYWAALTGAYALESLLRLPVVVRTPAVFSAYSNSTLTVRSLLLAVSPSGECKETLQAAQRAKKQSATVWAVTADPQSTLGKLADGVVQIYLYEASADGIQSAFGQHAAVVFLALAAARALKRRVTSLDAQEKDLQKLPENVERVQNQFADAARALANELSNLHRLWLTGGGLYHPIALQAASHLSAWAGIRAGGFDLAHFQHALPTSLDAETGILFLSGSRCALKAAAHQAAQGARKIAGGKLFAITDSNDRQLSDNTVLSVLLPMLTEPAGALLTLAFLDSVADYAARNSAASSFRRKAASSDT